MGNVLQVYKAHFFIIRWFEDEQRNLWFVLNDVLKALGIGVKDFDNLGFDTSEFKTLSNGIKLINESIFFHHIIALHAKQARLTDIYQCWWFEYLR